jgi:hypothetical protein
MFKAVATLPMQKVEKSTWFEFIRKMLFVGCKDTKSFPKLLCFTAEKCKKGRAKVRHIVPRTARSRAGDGCGLWGYLTGPS